MKTSSFYEQMTAVVIALVLSSAIAMYLGITPEATTDFSLAKDFSDAVLALTSRSSLSPEAIPISVCFFLALSVLALKESHGAADAKDLTGPHDKAVVRANEMSVAVALILGLTAVAIEAPMHPTGGLFTGVIVSSLLATLPREESPNAQSGAVALLKNLEGRARQPLVEILFVTFACLLLIAPPLGGDVVAGASQADAVATQKASPSFVYGIGFV